MLMLEISIDSIHVYKQNHHFNGRSQNPRLPNKELLTTNYTNHLSNKSRNWDLRVKFTIMTSKIKTQKTLVRKIII